MKSKRAKDGYVLHLHAHGGDWYFVDSEKKPRFVKVASKATHFWTVGEAENAWDYWREKKNIRGWNVSPVRYPGRKFAAKVRMNPHKAGTADKAAARELKLFIDSEPRFDARRVAISKNLEAKFKRKTYSDAKAAKLWERLATDGAKAYATEYARTGEWNTVFSGATRRLTARLMARNHAIEMRAGNFH